MKSACGDTQRSNLMRLIKIVKMKKKIVKCKKFVEVSNLRRDKRNMWFEK